MASAIDRDYLVNTDPKSTKFCIGYVNRVLHRFFSILGYDKISTAWSIIWLPSV